MTDKDFDKIQSQLQELYAQKEYQQAYDLATQHCDQFPEQSHLLNYWRSTMAAQTGNRDLAIEILKEVIDSGFWYGEALLRHNPAYKALQADPLFEQLVLQNRNLQELEQER